MHGHKQLLQLNCRSSQLQPYWTSLKQVAADPQLSKIKEDLAEDSATHSYSSLDHGRLLHKGRLVLSGSSLLIPKLLDEVPQQYFGGHSGLLRTYKHLAEDLYQLGMKKDVKKFVEECPACQKNKSFALSPTVLMQPLPIPQLIWEDISMDFIGGLSKSGGYNSILVVVDQLSKYAHFLGLKHPFYISRCGWSIYQGGSKASRHSLVNCPRS